MDVKPVLRKDESQMTRREFRYSLLETMKENGIADKLKSHLRASLVAELKKKSLFTQKTNSNSELCSPLTTRLIDSLVVDHLKKKGSEFTLSVFVPEAGLNAQGALLAEEDIYRVLHLNAATTLVRSYRAHIDSFPQTASIIVKLLESLSRVLEIPAHEKECQTELDETETVETELRRLDNTFLSSSKLSNRGLLNAMESRVSKFQQELELRMENELEAQLSRFKDVELAKMRIEERSKYANEVAHVRGEYELKLVEQRERIMETEEGQRKWIEEREKDLEAANLELRQRILEESNRSVLLESQLRSEAQLSVKSLTMENATLRQKLQDSKQHMEELESFKERYATKTQEAIAQYKIDLNREHAELISNVQVEKAKIESEKAILVERSRVAERMMEQVEESRSEMEDLRNQLKTLRTLLHEANREKEDAIFKARDLKLQVSSQSSAAAVEFEIHSLKTSEYFFFCQDISDCELMLSKLCRQLLEAEKMGAKRQEEYQSLLKSFMAPQNDLQKENAKLRKSESKWQRECQELVAKLDLELNRNETLERQLENEVLRNKELKRDLAEVRILLHRLQAGRVAARVTGDDESVVEEGYGYSRDILPNPYDIMNSHSNASSPYRNIKKKPSAIPVHLPLHRPGNDSPPRGMPPPTDNVSPIKQFSEEWDQGTQRMKAVAYRAGRGALGYFDEGERNSNGLIRQPHADVSAASGVSENNALPVVSVDMDSFADEVLEKFSGDSVSGSNEGHRPSLREEVNPLQYADGASDAKLRQPESRPEKVPSLAVPTTKEPVPTPEEVRKSFEESLKAIQLPSRFEEPKPEAALSSTRKGTSLKDLMKQEEEEENAARAEREKMQRDYERRRLDRERRDQELEELERQERIQKNASEEVRREMEMAKLAGFKARKKEEQKQNSGSNSGGTNSLTSSNDSTSSGSVIMKGLLNTASQKKIAEPDKGNQDLDLKILNELEEDPAMQKYMAIVKERRQKEKSNPELTAAASKEKVDKIFKELENTSLSASDKSGHIASGDTIDDISAPSTAEEALDDPW
ncbi:oxidative DNA demethylase [Chytriomyces hyalinus]|nr:oxidative DNA demethylase [Chytriomyces hyalinus]